MRAHEKIIAPGLLLVFLATWSVFLAHEDPRFAGSALGGLFGVLALAAMAVAYLYPVAKRIPPVKRMVSKRASVATLLELHVYVGIVGPILGIIHSGHKFESPTGIALVALTFGVVFSGFVGRYLFGAVSADVREKKAMLAALEQEYHHLALEVAAGPGHAGLLSRVSNVSEAVADVEYALATDERARRLFSRWLLVHIVLSLALLALLALHVVSSFYYGVRWLQG